MKDMYGDIGVGVWNYAGKLRDALHIARRDVIQEAGCLSQGKN